jgi:hypothetical protein
MPVSLLILLISLVTGSCLVVTHFWRKGRQRQQDFQKLRQRVIRLRLFKMLTHLGVNLDDYIHKVPSSDIEKHIFNCTQCAQFETCDTCLRDGRIILDMNFCPNYGLLTSHSRTIAADK